MPRSQPSIFRIFRQPLWLACAALGLAACASPEVKISDKPQPAERVYFASFEEISRAIKQAMIKYPPKVDNAEAGIFETDYVKGDARFRQPQSEKLLPSGLKYRILIRLVRGRTDEKDAVKVVITKQPELARDFFSDPEILGTDGLEENVILYRIQRELAVDRAIRRAQDRLNHQSTGS